MPSFKNIAAIAALMGLASAMPQTGPYSNGTAGAIGNSGNATTGASGPLSTGTSAGAAQANNGTSTGPVSGSNSTSVANDSLFCPSLNAQVYIDQNGASFLIECGTLHFGIIIDVFGGNSTLSKRATVPTNLGDCMLECDATEACVGTAFNTAASTCTLYSEVGAAYAQANTDFAVRVASGDAASTIAAGQTATSTLYSTNVVTISSCAPTVTDCPLRNGANAVVTQVIPVQSTEYICPTASVVPAAPVACGCAYSASTAMLYSATVQSGSTVVVPVTSTVIAVPQPTGTTYAVTTYPASGTNSLVTLAPTAPGAMATASLTTVCPGCEASATTSSGLMEFTGAASNIKAGMGMGAFVAAAALLL